MTRPDPPSQAEVDLVCHCLGDHRSVFAGAVSAEVFSAAARRLLASWQVLGATGPRLLQLGEAHRQTDAWRRLADAVLGVGAYARTQTRAFHDVVDALEAAGLPYVLLKANAVRFFAYREPATRTGWDLDLAVAPDDVRRAERVIRDAGFVPAEMNTRTGTFHRADPALRAAVESRHYELGFLIRRQLAAGLGDEELEAIEREPFNAAYWRREAPGLVCYITIDVHHGLSLDIGSGEILASARPAPWHEGRTVSLPSVAWMLLHLLFKLYWEGVHNYSKGLYQFADLVRLVARAKADDFAQLDELLRRHNLCCAAFYCLSRLERSFSVTLPDAARELVERYRLPLDGLGAGAQNDLGDPWPKLWGVRALA